MSNAETWDVKGKVALITGASRGIGRAIAERLARQGVHVMVAAKTTEPHPKLPGTVQEAAEACSALGAEAAWVKMDVRDDAQVQHGVEETIRRFGRLDIAIHNAGALWWKPIAETPLKKYDLVMEVNARAAYALAYHAIPHLKAAGGGHFLVMSPPVELGALPGKVAYLMSKFGMSLVALGLAEEHRRDSIAANALWPETAIESSATVNFGLGGPSMWYKADIVADAAWEVIHRPPHVRTGQTLLVMDVLREAGINDFTDYRCDPASEPPMLNVGALPRAGGQETAGGKVAL